MTDPDAAPRPDRRDVPQLYLITPPEIDLDTFPGVLASCLDREPVACLRLSLATRDEDLLARAADTLREIAHARDVALVIDGHPRLVARLGLDGVHLTDGARSVRKMRKDLDQDPGGEVIIGTFCGASRHDGLTAGELGADYVSFGPVGDSALGLGIRAETELFQWWSEMIEVPCVAEGALTPELVRAIAPFADFLGLGDEVWRTDDPAGTLALYAAAMG
ncbi:MAG: thiamine phosphate synthase [Rubellimicrobium sp.]|nr:thiamine phosphate synthase [Rubellimicrobium sp.]